MWQIFFWYTLGPLAPTEYFLNTAAYLSIVASDGGFQQGNVPWHKARIISNWFLEHNGDFHCTQMGTTVTILSPVNYHLDVLGPGIHIMDVQSTNVPRLCDVICQYGQKSF